MHRTVSVVAALTICSAILACGSPQRCPTAPRDSSQGDSLGANAAASATPAPPPLTDAERAHWKALREKGPPAGATAAEILTDVEALLASPDPARRDGVAYELLAAWLLADATAAAAVADATAAGLRDRLTARTASDSAASTVFARSFAALALSVVAARDVKRNVWTAADLDAQIAAAAAYAARETDLRGYTDATTGWAHAAAHTADWLKFLARHPKLTAAQARTLLAAITSLAARRHGARLSHGEDERMAAAARAVLRRGLVDDAAVDAWLRTVGEPLTAGWPDPFDPQLYAAQRNARDFLVSLFVALTFDDAPPAAAALARLRAFMMQ